MSGDKNLNISLVGADVKKKSFLTIVVNFSSFLGKNLIINWAKLKLSQVPVNISNIHTCSSSSDTSGFITSSETHQQKCPLMVKARAAEY